MATEEAAAEVPWSITYHDGSANGFRVWKDTRETSARFAYTPVQPGTSSSGVYSGGTKTTGEVDRDSALELWRWVRRLEADSSLRVEAREKGTGAFVVKASSGDEQAFVVKDGPRLRAFNAFLARFR